MLREKSYTGLVRNKSMGITHRISMLRTTALVLSPKV